MEAKRTWIDRHGLHRSTPPPRRFASPWVIEEQAERLIVRAAAGQALGYFYYDGQRRPPHSQAAFTLRDCQHHAAAQTSMIVPSGSGAASAPNSASVAGDPNRFLNENRSMKVMAERPSSDIGAIKLTVS